MVLPLQQQQRSRQLTPPKQPPDVEPAGNIFSFVPSQLLRGSTGMDPMYPWEIDIG